MRKRLNIKLVAGLGIGSLLFFAGIHFLHGFQVRRNADGLLDRATAARDSGDRYEAIRLTSRYLAHRPDDAEQYRILAIDSKKHLFELAESNRDAIKAKMIQQTSSLMEEAIRKNAEDVELRREAADFWFNMQRYSDAKTHLEFIIAANAATADDELRHVQCLRGEGTPASESQAIKGLESFIGYDAESGTYSAENAKYPTELSAYQTLAVMHIEQDNDVDEALKIVNQMVATNPDNYKAYLGRASLMRVIRPSDGTSLSDQDTNTAYDMAPEELDALIAKTNLLARTDLSAARKLLEQGLAKIESSDEKTSRRDKAQIYNMLAELEIRDGQTDTALEVIERGLKDLKSDPILLWTKAQIYVDRKDFDTVDKMEKQMRDAGVADPKLAFLRARRLFAAKEYLVVSKQLAAIRPHVDKELQYQVDTYLTTCYSALGQPDSLLATLESMLQVTPTIVPLQLNYVRTLDQLGRSDEALGRLRAIKQSLQAGEQQLPAELVTMEASILMRVDPAMAKQNIQATLNNPDVDDLQKYALAVDFLIKEDKKPEALKWVKRAIEKLPEEFVFWGMLMDLAETEQEARDAFAKMEAKFDDRVALREMRARMAIKYDVENAASVIKQQEENADVFEPSERADLYRRLGILQLALRNQNEAVRLLEAAHTMSPSRLDILTTLYELASAGSDPEMINDIVKRIETLTTRNDDTWKMSEAGRLVWRVRRGLDDKSSLTRATGLLQEVRNSRPQWIPVFLLEADIHRVNGDVNAAIRSLENALALQPTNISVMRQLRDLTRAIGDLDRSQAYNEQLPEDRRSERDKQAELEMLVQQGKYAEAKDILDDVVSPSSTQPRDHLIRSEILAKAGDLPGAEEAALRAKELEPGLGQVWTNLINVMVQQGKQAEAEGFLQDAELSLDETTKPIVLGQCYALLGNLNLAQNNLHTALQNDPNNVGVKRMLSGLYLQQGQNQRGVQLLMEILKDADPTEHANEIQNTRRALAQVLGSTGSYTGFQKALEYLDENAPDGNLSGKDLQLWIALSIARPEQDSWKLAINKLDLIEKQRTAIGGSLSDDELFMKAQLFEKYEELWPEAKRIAVDVLTRNQGNQVIIERLVGWHLKRGELDEADTWKRHLDPGSTIRVRVEVHALAAQKRHKEAAQRLQALMPKDLNDKADYSQLVTVAAITEELGQYDKGYYTLAEKQLDRLIAKEPTQILRKATLMGLRGDVDKIKQSLEMCRNAHEVNIPVGVSAAVAIAIVREHPDLWDSSLASSIEGISQWLDQESSANPDDMAFKARVAEFHDLMGNLDRVISDYRSILGSGVLKNPRERGMILNNLAYAMALNGDKTGEPLKLIEEAVDLLGPTGDILDTRGYTHLVSGDVNKAVDDFGKAIGGGAKTVHKLFHLSLALDQQGSGQAKDVFNEALGLGLNEYKLPRALQEKFQRLKLKYQ